MDINDAQLFRWCIHFSSKDRTLSSRGVLLLSSITSILKMKKVEQKGWILYAFCIQNQTFLLHFAVNCSVF